MGTDETVLVYYQYRNCDATYTFTSDSKNFVVKETIKKDPGSNGVYIVAQTYTAKKPGTYTVTVKETYNKKTRVVGKVEYEVKKATVYEEYSLCFAQVQDIDSWMKMVEIVRDNFPGLETAEGLEDYRQTVIKNVERKTALCVKYDNEIVGVMLFSYNSQCLSCMAVHPNHQGKGIGKKLLKFAEDYARNQGFSSIRLDVYTENPSAVSLYEKAGYKEKGEVTFPFRKVPYKCFEKVLKGSARDIE
jgi:ribosomal protein S18 acetylase RimI-like enzyme